jgi:hypothetical protein
VAMLMAKVGSLETQVLQQQKNSDEAAPDGKGGEICAVKIRICITVRVSCIGKTLLCPFGQSRLGSVLLGSLKFNCKRSPTQGYPPARKRSWLRRS